MRRIKEFLLLQIDIIPLYTCPFCSERRVIPGVNSLQALYPDIAKLYSTKNHRTADEVFPTLTSLHIWDCPDCGGEYNAPIDEVVNGSYTCPFCSGRRVIPGTNSLQALYPDIAKLYSAKNHRTADEVFPTLTSLHIWDCPDCGGEYNAPINEVVNGSYTCPFCSGRRVLSGFNDFATSHPELMAEYDPIMNYIVTDIDVINPKSGKSLWWICPKNPDHQYYMSPARKLWYQKRHRESCPYCKGLRRKKRHFI